MSDKKSAILNVAKGLTENYASEELFMPKSGQTSAEPFGDH